jgi:hypothetical protein
MFNDLARSYFRQKLFATKYDLKMALESLKHSLANDRNPR